MFLHFTDFVGDFLSIIVICHKKMSSPDLIMDVILGSAEKRKSYRHFNDSRVSDCRIFIFLKLFLLLCNVLRSFICKFVPNICENMDIRTDSLDYIFPGLNSLATSLLTRLL